MSWGAGYPPPIGQTMVEKLLRKLHSRSGQAIIEFVVVFPLIIMLLAAIVDFGIAFDRRITLQHAVREGARFAAVHTVEADIKDRTFQQAQNIITSGDVDVCYIDGPDDGATVGDPGDPVRVTVRGPDPPGLGYEYHLNFVGPILSGLFGFIGFDDTIHMKPSGTARLEVSVSGATPCS